MKTKFLLCSIFCLLLNFNLSAEDVEIYSDNIKILDDNNIIKSTNTKASIKEKKLFLEGKSSIYDKRQQKITLTGDTIFIDKLKNLKISNCPSKYKCPICRYPLLQQSQQSQQSQPIPLPIVQLMLFSFPTVL